MIDSSNPKHKHCHTCDSTFTEETLVCPIDGTELALASRHAVSSLKGMILAETYELTEELGRGGMGKIYAGRNLKALEGESDKVAIKLLLDHALSNEIVRHRFTVEAKAAASLDHPSIVKVHKYDITEDGLPFIVMDYLEGQTLEELLASGKLELEEVLGLVAQTCDALAHAHRHNIVHRDIKPANIVVLDNQSGLTPIIVDFGIAKIFSQPGKTSLRLTKTGDVFGSPLYMSPEQCMGQRLDHRADIYAVGCMLYECVVGHAPFSADNVLALIFKHISEEPTRFARSRTEKLLESVIFKALEKHPDDRYQSMTELRRAIEESLAIVGGRAAAEVEAISASDNDTADDIMTDYAYYETRALEGDASAQLELWLFYKEGTIEADFEESFQWCLKAATQGHTEAMAELGDLFFQGKFVEQDTDKAYYWYKRAAQQGQAGAHRMIGHIFNTGSAGIEVDRKQAFDWYQKAANLDDVEAQFLLGELYMEGDESIDVDMDIEAALAWYTRAANHGDREAQMALGLAYQNQELGIEMDLAKSLVWFIAAAEQGDAAAMRCVATFYEYGDVVEKDLEESMRWMEAAAEHGDAEAKYWMSRWQREGSHGLNRNIDAATRLLRASAEDGYVQAQYELALNYLTGENVARNPNKAAEWLREAAEQGLDEAKFELAILYRDGRGVRQNTATYLKMITALAESSMPEAQNELGMHFESQGKLKRARHCFEKAAGSGMTEAKQNLIRLELGNYETSLFVECRKFRCGCRILFNLG